jgi:putative transposase
MNISQSAEGSTGMARIARVVVPGLPHHVTQRDDRREPVFFEADGYRPYRRLAAAAARRAGIPVWAYCLMPNHVHLACADGGGWVAGDLCRGGAGTIPRRSASVPMDGPSIPGSLWRGGDGQPHLLAAAGYIALNPMVAGLASRSSLAMVEHSGAIRGRG